MNGWPAWTARRITTPRRLGRKRLNAAPTAFAKAYRPAPIGNGSGSAPNDAYSVAIVIVFGKDLLSNKTYPGIENLKCCFIGD